MTAALQATDVRFSYGERLALDGLDVSASRGTVHAFLGPNGSGKSTLFKLLATLIEPQQGDLRLLDLDVTKDAAALRNRIGVVFQSPAVDRKLTVRQNLVYGGKLFGLGGGELSSRIDGALAAAGIQDRAGDKVEDLSGGLQRRVELAKVLLHQPELLLLDEPSTGLDPAARQELWRALRSDPERTVLFTTHLMDEAAQADQVTILHEGRVVGDGTPDELVASVGDEVVEVECADPAAIRAALTIPESMEVLELDRSLRIRGAGAHRAAPEWMAAVGERIDRLSMGRPTLEDVFLSRTGTAFVASDPEPTKKSKRRRKR